MASRLFGAQPLSEPMLAHCQLHHEEHIPVKFYLKFKSFHLMKCTWMCRLWNDSHLSGPQCVNSLLLEDGLSRHWGWSALPQTTMGKTVPSIKMIIMIMIIIIIIIIIIIHFNNTSHIYQHIAVSKPRKNIYRSNVHINFCALQSYSDVWRSFIPNKISFTTYPLTK